MCTPHYISSVEKGIEIAVAFLKFSLHAVWHANSHGMNCAESRLVYAVTNQVVNSVH